MSDLRAFWDAITGPAPEDATPSIGERIAGSVVCPTCQKSVARVFVDDDVWVRVWQPAHVPASSVGTRLVSGQTGEVLEPSPFEHLAGNVEAMGWTMVRHVTGADEPDREGSVVVECWGHHAVEFTASLCWEIAELHRASGKKVRRPGIPIPYSAQVE